MADPRNASHVHAGRESLLACRTIRAVATRRRSSLGRRLPSPSRPAGSP